jgi:hypothetical protein
LGVVLATPGTLSLLPRSEIGGLLDRHAGGDWDDVPPSDARANDQALVGHGERLFSAYETPAGRVWIITEADRSATTVLLPEEY